MSVDTSTHNVSLTENLQQKLDDAGAGQLSTYDRMIVGNVLNRPAYDLLVEAKEDRLDVLDESYRIQMEVLLARKEEQAIQNQTELTDAGPVVDQLIEQKKEIDGKLVDLQNRRNEAMIHRHENAEELALEILNTQSEEELDKLAPIQKSKDGQPLTEDAIKEARFAELQRLLLSEQISQQEPLFNTLETLAKEDPFFLGGALEQFKLSDSAQYLAQRQLLLNEQNANDLALGAQDDRFASMLREERYIDHAIQDLDRQYKQNANHIISQYENHELAAHYDHLAETIDQSNATPEKKTEYKKMVADMVAGANSVEQLHESASKKFSNLGIDSTALNSEYSKINVRVFTENNKVYMQQDFDGKTRHEKQEIKGGVINLSELKEATHVSIRVEKGVKRELNGDKIRFIGAEDKDISYFAPGYEFEVAARQVVKKPLSNGHVVIESVAKRDEQGHVIKKKITSRGADNFANPADVFSTEGLDADDRDRLIGAGALADARMAEKGEALNARLAESLQRTNERLGKLQERSASLSAQIQAADERLETNRNSTVATNQRGGLLFDEGALLANLDKVPQNSPELERRNLRDVDIKNFTQSTIPGRGAEIADSLNLSS